MAIATNQNDSVFDGHMDAPGMFLLIARVVLMRGADDDTMLFLKIFAALIDIPDIHLGHPADVPWAMFFIYPDEVALG